MCIDPVMESANPVKFLVITFAISLKFAHHTVAREFLTVKNYSKVKPCIQQGFSLNTFTKLLKTTWFLMLQY